MCVQTAKVLARLHQCRALTSVLFAYVITIAFTWASSPELPVSRVLTFYPISGLFSVTWQFSLKRVKQRFQYLSICCVCKQWRLWWDWVNAQARLSHRFSPMWWLLLSHGQAHLSFLSPEFQLFYPIPRLFFCNLAISSSKGKTKVSVSQHMLCVQTVKALVRLRKCAGSPEPSLFAYVMTIAFTWASSPESSVSRVSTFFILFPDFSSVTWQFLLPRVKQQILVSQHTLCVTTAKALARLHGSWAFDVCL